MTGDGAVVNGPPATDLADMVEGAEFLVNISGNLSSPTWLRRFRRRAYIDVDPGYTQYWHAAGVLGSSLLEHEAWFTVGGNIATCASPVPTNGIRWRAVRPPVVLTEWPVHLADATNRMTAVAGWRGRSPRWKLKGVVMGSRRTNGGGC